MITRYLSVSELAEANDAIRASDLVAVDTEFHAEHRWLPELYLLQIGTADGRVWIVDPLVPGLLPGLADALRSTPWVVHGGEQDLRLLEVALGGLPARVRDTQIEAALLDDHFPAAYATLVQGWLGQEVDKGETLSDWSRRPLSPSQLSYAAKDVALLLPLARVLERRLAEVGRAEAAAAACAEAAADAVEVDDRTLFRELHASQILEGVQLALLQELAAWREQRARATNQPSRSVLGDAALTEIARRHPTAAGELTANRRIGKAVSRYADELSQLVRRVLERPADSWPRAVPRRGPAARTAAFLQLWAQLEGSRSGWAANLVLPRQLAEDLVLAPPATREAWAEQLGWREALCGEGLRAVLGGRVSLRVAESDLLAGEDPASDRARENFLR